MAGRLGIDWGFALSAALLAAIGIAALGSATGIDGPVATRQLLWLAIGSVALGVFVAIRYRTWSEVAIPLYAINAAVLVYVLLFGHRVNGSKSWLLIENINLGQPSEFMKLSTVLVAARVLAAHRAERATFALLLRLGIVVGIPIALILMQPDMGTALTFAALLGVCLFACGLSKKVWALLALGGVLGAGLGWSYVLKGYQKERLLTFFNPEIDARATGYQIIQSKIAIGSGGFLGKGYAAGTQSQLNFIPEKHTDFIFPVVAEEWGFVGSAVVLGLFAFLLSRGLSTALEARDAFGAYAVLGIMAMVATHVLINLGMVTGLLPTIGIPLPLVSYGGSSIVTTLAGVGFVLNVRMRRTAAA